MGGEGCLVERGRGLLEGGSLFEGEGGLIEDLWYVVISPEKKGFITRSES